MKRAVLGGLSRELIDLCDLETKVKKAKKRNKKRALS